MKLADLPAGSSCLVDANIIVCYFLKDVNFGAESDRFFERVLKAELVAYTSPLVVADALHKIMLGEVRAAAATAKPLAPVQRHPELISSLSVFHAAAQDVPQLKLAILPVDYETFCDAAIIARQEKLLTNDTCNIAVMRKWSLTHLVSNDDDFDQVQGSQVWKPRT